MRWTRDQYLALMTFGDAPRAMFTELFGPLVGLPEEWRAQGASEEEISLAAFEWDSVQTVPCGGSAGPRQKAPIILEDTPEHRIEIDYLGRRTMLCKKTATLPLPMDFPVRTMDDWLKVKPLFEFGENRIDWDQVARARAEQADGKLVIGYIPGAFDTVRELMGEENGCLAYYDQPELIADIMATLADTAQRVFEPISEKVVIDRLGVHEDFAGRNGPLVGPRQIREHFRPYYRRVWDMLASRGSQVFGQDTDGNINVVLDDLLDCGLNCVYPMEPAAGMDMVQVRRTYGRRLAFWGGIDKHVLRQDKAAIRRELEYKLQPMMRKGTVFSLDHRIPNGTPLENYRYYVDLGREILELPPRTGGATICRGM